jgi:hypothetical protein
MTSKPLSAEYRTGKVYVCKLAHGGDLLDGITTFCKEKKIKMAAVSAIGALSAATVAYYDQKKRVYREITFKGHFEILALTGNVSLKDGSPLCHAHVLCGDGKGRVFGGHLLRGCAVFACELTVIVLKGKPLERGYDEATGLPLWRE